MANFITAVYLKRYEPMKVIDFMTSFAHHSFDERLTFTYVTDKMAFLAIPTKNAITQMCMLMSHWVKIR